MFADLVPGTGSVAVSVGVSTALDAATLLSRARPLSVRLLGADHQPRAAAALRQRARRRGASRARRRRSTSASAMRSTRLLARQGSNGSFGLWSVGGDDVWLDAYVTDFLTRARERRFAVPGRGVQARARPPAQLSSATPTEPSKNGGRDLAYALYVLARNGAAPIGDLRYFADTKLDDFATPIAKAQIAAALGHAGRPRARRARLCGGARRRIGAAARARYRPRATTARRCAMPRRW